MSMEFVMGSSLESLPKTIDFNFEELKTQLAESLELYAGLVVTEDGIKAAKEDRARLNKLREALETKRKEVKRECMAPYDRIKRLTDAWSACYNQFHDALDGGVEADYWQEKLDSLLRDVLKDHQPLIPFRERYPEIREVSYGGRK